jgi:hypothetical protein
MGGRGTLTCSNDFYPPSRRLQEGEGGGVSTPVELESTPSVFEYFNCVLYSLTVDLVFSANSTIQKRESTETATAVGGKKTCPELKFLKDNF